jgi:hypothetical protein
MRKREKERGKRALESVDRDAGVRRRQMGEELGRVPHEQLLYPYRLE